MIDFVRAYQNLAKALRRVERLAAMYDSADHFNVREVSKIVGDIKSTAERALVGVETRPQLSPIEIERLCFRKEHGMTYRRAEQFWHTEAMAGRKIPDKLAKAIIEHAYLEMCWQENGMC